MSQPSFEYVGTELDLFAGASNWRDYWASFVRPLLGEDVLEVGAGIGSVTRLLHVAGQRWTALEPDPELAQRTRAVLDADRIGNGVEVVCGSIDDLPVGRSFDTAIYIDVLEHIENDQEEVRRAFDRLRPGGRLVVLAPAHQWLFTPFDKAVGHFRRYGRARLRSLRPENGSEELAIYLDAAGLLASGANRVLLRSAAPTHQQIQLWDRRLVPTSRLIDPLLRHSIGKSVLVVWRKQGSSTDE